MVRRCSCKAKQMNILRHIIRYLNLDNVAEAEISALRA
jgi:hypothetical protein